MHVNFIICNLFVLWKVFTKLINDFEKLNARVKTEKLINHLPFNSATFFPQYYCIVEKNVHRYEYG